MRWAIIPPFCPKGEDTLSDRSRVVSAVCAVQGPEGQRNPDSQQVLQVIIAGRIQTYLSPISK